ncbi:kinase-like protein [Polychaeton citri CBS 116435]|uniref:Kinase-like protein n=1 Tax=Polychaeton citri CBS 116435 TaxID=1314669 RepID=A0A9P4Q2J9_9PEZI|nr:kinase-like protein [Polychaeton citri CBS 116435]
MVICLRDALLFVSMMMCGIALTVSGFINDAKARISKTSRVKKCRCTSCKRDRRLHRMAKLPLLRRVFPSANFVEDVEKLDDVIDSDVKDEQEVGGWEYNTFASWDAIGPAALVDISDGSDNINVYQRDREHSEVIEGDPEDLLNHNSKYDPQSSPSDIDWVTPESGLEVVPETLLDPSNRIQDAKLQEHFHIKWLQNHPRNPNKVSVMQHKPSGNLRVVKTRSIPYDKNGSLLMPYELELMRDLIPPHANLVQFLGYDLVDDNSGVRDDAAGGEGLPDAICHIFLEYCDFGDLFSFMDRWDRYQDPYIPSIFLLHTWASLSSALSFLHCGLREVNGHLEKDNDAIALVHCDIKPQNIFLRWTPFCQYGMPDIVLGDLGLCTPYDSWRNRGACGTLGYQPPEVEWISEALYGEPNEASLETHMNASKARYNRLWSPAGDVWAVGAVMAELATLETSRPVSALFNCEIWGKDLDEQFWMSLEKMLHDDAEERIKSEALASLALKMKSNIHYLYDHGEHMPDDCWRDPEMSIDACTFPHSLHSADKKTGSLLLLVPASSAYSRSMSSRMSRMRASVPREVTSCPPSR